MNDLRRKGCGEQSRGISVEAVLWIIVGVAALALRVADLGAAPLSQAEAREAMLAWRAANGQELLRTDYSPFLLAANTFLFTLSGGSDALARLWPALFGTVLVLTPLLLRPWLGRVGALAAALFLAVSPTSLVASRQADGAALAATGGMLFVGGIVQFLAADRRRWLGLSAVGLALGLTSSPMAYGLLLPLGFAWLISLYVTRKAEPASRLERHVSRLRPHAAYFSLVLLAAVVGLSTGLGWNLGGIGGVGGVLAGWFARFGPATEPVASPFTVLIAYEPLALLFGVGGLVWGVRRRRRCAVLLGVWAGLGLVLLLVMPGRAPLDLLWVVLPLTMLGGRVIEELVTSFGLERRSQRSADVLVPHVIEGLYGLVVAILWCHLYLMMARYAVLGDGAALSLALLALGLQALLLAGFAVTVGPGASLRAFALSTGAILLAATLSTGWGAAHANVSDPREPLLGQPTDVAVRDLTQTLRDLSWRRTGLPGRLKFAYQAEPTSVMAWYLRHFTDASRIHPKSQPPAGNAGSVLVTSGRELSVGTEGDYAGQDFVLHRRWRPADLDCNDRARLGVCRQLVRWALFRDTDGFPAASSWATLWLATPALED